MKRWARRAGELHDEVSAVADVGRADPRWWLVAAGAAVVEPWPARGTYMVSDAEPGADTFMGIVTPRPRDVIADAIARAHAARAALRELDGALPDQPLAITVKRDAGGATTEPSRLDTAAFAIGARVLVVRLADDITREQPLATLLAHAIAEGATGPGGREAYRLDDTGTLVPDIRAPSNQPFVAISLGDDPIATARHGHRRAWGAEGGPWLGLGRADDLAIVSTCHMIIDGFGHGRLTGLIAAHHARLLDGAPGGIARALPALIAPAGGTPLGIAWRSLEGHAPRAIRIGYALGRVLHRRAGRPEARFSPTFQIPVAPGRFDDDTRRRRRVVFSITSLRFDDGEPEPYDVFAARVREILAREAAGLGLCARMLAAARAAPAPLAWKRRQFSASRPRWLDRISDVLGGRACLSRITLDAASPPLCAVSSPSRLATRGDPFGACVLTVIDDGTRGAITACGSGLAGDPADATTLLDELFALL